MRNYIIALLLTTTIVFAQPRMSVDKNSTSRSGTKIVLNEHECDSLQYYADTNLPFVKCHYTDNQLVTKKYFYRSGEVNVEMEFRNGLQIGEEKWFYRNGQLNNLIPFSAGLAHGISYTFDMKGAKTDSTLYVEGQKVSFSQFEENFGSLIR